MKKKLVWLLAGIMVVGMLGCGSKSETTTEETETTETSTEASAETTDTTEETEEESNPSISELEDISEYVTLCDYKNITVQVTKTEVTDEAVEDYIDSYMLSTYEVTDRAVENGDVAVIDFTGYLDGEAFDGVSSEGYSLEIGSGSFIDGFEDGLVGVMPGETVDLNLTFPEDYSSEDLAGKDVVFTVTVQGIQESTTYAELTEEQLIAMDLGYSTKEELWDAAVEALEAEYEESYTNSVTSAALDEILNNSTFNEVPDYLVDESLQSYLDYYEMICYYYYGTDLETFVSTYYGMTVDEYKESLREDVTEEVKQELAIEAIGRAEGLVPSDDEVLEEAQNYADNYGYESVDELYEAGGGRGSFVTYLTQNKVLEYLSTIVTVEDAEVTE